MAFGAKTSAAHAATDRDSRPPKGKPTSTFSRDVPRSRSDQPSSTAPEEKKNTS